MKKTTYLWEPHAHTKEVSECARVPAAEMVEAYVQAGYSGIVITDHLNPEWIREEPYRSDWKKAVEHFYEGYRNAVKAAKRRITVLPGIELRLTQNSNDYLIYGLGEEELLEYKEIPLWPLRKVCETLREKSDVLIYQAHPFRNGMTITEPHLLDGIEVFNACKRHDSRNSLALQWAKQFDLLKISGTDYHWSEDVGLGGFLTDEVIKIPADLLEVLRHAPRLIFPENA